MVQKLMQIFKDVCKNWEDFFILCEKKLWIFYKILKPCFICLPFLQQNFVKVITNCMNTLIFNKVFQQVFEKKTLHLQFFNNFFYELLLCLFFPISFK